MHCSYSAPVLVCDIAVEVSVSVAARETVALFVAVRGVVAARPDVPRPDDIYVPLLREIVVFTALRTLDADWGVVVARAVAFVALRADDGRAPAAVVLVVLLFVRETKDVAPLRDVAVRADAGTVFIAVLRTLVRATDATDWRSVAFSSRTAALAMPMNAAQIRAKCRIFLIPS